MKNEFTLTAAFNTSAEAIYKAWLTTQGHTLMTGSPATIDGREGGDFTAWDGYIWGSFLELEEYKRIVQVWRTGEFPEEAKDSRVEVLLEEANGETKLKLFHTIIPEGQAESYKQGWDDFYFKPMKEYFG
ncbi:MAG: SRPBCC domain-containing protein [Anaerolineales bacterium]|nr:SRPBCC domain-containing protein [Anaerolineales bacterium]